MRLWRKLQTFYPRTPTVTPRKPTPRLQAMTEHNRLALPYYLEACRILALPFDQRRAAIGDDDRLAGEVMRIYEQRKQNANTP